MQEVPGYIIESGTAAGATETTAAGLSTTEDFCGFQAGGFSSSPTPLPCVPFVWTGSTMLPLPTLGGVNGGANEINNSGSIAGYAENKTLDPGCTAAQAGPQKYQFKPVVWNHGAIQALPTGNDAEGVAISINDHGQIVGVSGSCAPLNPVWLFYLAMKHALLWQNGAATDLGNLGGEINNVAHHINNLGQVVGQSDLAAIRLLTLSYGPGQITKCRTWKPSRTLSTMTRSALGLASTTQEKSPAFRRMRTPASFVRLSAGTENSSI